MKLDVHLEELKHGAVLIQSLVSGITPEECRFKPAADTWSILEVLGHLLDEERYDFRQHLARILDTPYPSEPQIDQAGTGSVPYNERDLSKTLNDFLEERRQSLVWLKNLPSPNWDLFILVPFGPAETPLRFSAGDMLTSWVAHDNLHMRQLVELRRARLLRLAEPYSVDYAGRW